MESAWADLPAEWLAIISDYLQEGTDIRRVRSVCRSWRSSFITIQYNNHVISPLFPRSLSWSIIDNANFFVSYYLRALLCDSRPQYLLANAVYHLRSSNNKLANWIVSVQESKPGKLLLLDALTCDPIPYSSGCRLDMSGWSLTRISLSQSFSPGPTRKVVLVDDESEPMSVFKCDYRGLYTLKRGQLVAVGGPSRVYDFLDFNGCIYVVDSGGVVYVLDPTLLQLLQLNCANLPQARCAMYTTTVKRFVVSDGDLYLVFSSCSAINTNYHEYHIYKLVMDDGINIILKRYNLEEVKDLGDRVFFINKDCSFLVSARDLPPPLVGNCILVSKGALPYCSCFSDFRIYHLGGNPARMARRLYHALFEPPLLWTHQLQRESLKQKQEEHVEKLLSNSMKNNPPTSAVGK